MAPKTRKRTPVRQSKREKTVVGSLELTPRSTSRDQTKRGDRWPDEESDGAIDAQQDSEAAPDGFNFFPSSINDSFDGQLDDKDFLSLEIDDNANPSNFAWSEVGSTSRRSSPVLADDTPGRSEWDLGDDSDPSRSPFQEDGKSVVSFEPNNYYSSPKPGEGALPSTMPLSQYPGTRSTEEPPGVESLRVDFSETASTMRRSSPLGFRDSLNQPWDFQTPVPGSCRASPQITSPAIPENNAARNISMEEEKSAAEAPTRPTTAQSLMRMMQSSHGSQKAPDHDLNSGPKPSASTHQAASRRRQRAKSPIIVDVDTQQVKAANAVPERAEGPVKADTPTKSPPKHFPQASRSRKRISKPQSVSKKVSKRAPKPKTKNSLSLGERKVPDIAQDSAETTLSDGSEFAWEPPKIQPAICSKEGLSLELKDGPATRTRAKVCRGGNDSGEAAYEDVVSTSQLCPMGQSNIGSLTDHQRLRKGSDDSSLTQIESQTMAQLEMELSHPLTGPALSSSPEPVTCQSGQKQEISDGGPSQPTHKDDSNSQPLAGPSSQTAGSQKDLAAIKVEMTDVVEQTRPSLDTIPKIGNDASSEQHDLALDAGSSLTQDISTKGHKTFVAEPIESSTGPARLAKQVRTGHQGYVSVCEVSMPDDGAETEQSPAQTGQARDGTSDGQFSFRKRDDPSSVFNSEHQSLDFKSRAVHNGFPNGSHASTMKGDSGNPIDVSSDIDDSAAESVESEVPDLSVPVQNGNEAQRKRKQTATHSVLRTKVCRHSPSVPAPHDLSQFCALKEASSCPVNVPIARQGVNVSEKGSPIPCRGPMKPAPDGIVTMTSSKEQCAPRLVWPEQRKRPHNMEKVCICQSTGHFGDQINISSPGTRERFTFAAQKRILSRGVQNHHEGTVRCVWGALTTVADGSGCYISTGSTRRWTAHNRPHL